MPTIADQLNELVNQKKALVSNLNTKGVSATEDEKLNTLVPKVLEITSGGGIDTSDATATSSDILSGKTAYVKGVKIEGNIPSKSQEIYTPSASEQYINSGQYLSGTQIISGDYNLIADNIKDGVSIFNVTGTHVGIESLTESNVSSDDIKNGKIAYGNNGEKITGTAYTINQSVTITPSVNEHYLKPGFYNGINIPGDTDLVASNIKKDIEIFGVIGTYEGTDTSDATATAADILTGKTAYVNGEKLTGTIPTHGTNTYTPTTENQYLETGYYSGEQCIEGDANLLPGNIRKGVSIFNVVGIYEGSQSSAEQVLFECDDSATEESIISEYGSIIQVNNSSPASFGNLSNFEDKKISAISNSVYPMKGLSYRVENDYSGFYFKTPFAITSSNCLLCMRNFVSTWINPTIHFNFIQADSVDDIPTKIENNDFILTKTVSVANTMNNNKIFYEFSIAPGEYYLYVSVNATGGNEAITNYISILNI